jgi:hypothetical protein
MASTSFSGFNKKNWGTPKDISAFQKYSNIKQDGIVGPDTIKALDNYFQQPSTLGLQPATSSFVYNKYNAPYLDSGLYGKQNNGFLPDNSGFYMGKQDMQYSPVNTSSVGGVVPPKTSDGTSFYDSLFSSPAAGENGWFAKGAKGPNESDVAYAERLKAPTTGMNVLNGIGTGVSALGGLYNMYQTKKNYDLEKQANEQKMALARASEANRSAMAKAFGSTYTPAQF